MVATITRYATDFIVDTYFEATDYLKGLFPECYIMHSPEKEIILKSIEEKFLKAGINYVDINLLLSVSFLKENDEWVDKNKGHRLTRELTMSSHSLPEPFRNFYENIKNMILATKTSEDLHIFDENHTLVLKNLNRELESLGDYNCGEALNDYEYIFNLCVENTNLGLPIKAISS